MELLIVYYALSSGRQNYTSCYCQLHSPHLSVFIFPFRTLKSTQRCSFQHKVYVPQWQLVYRMFRDRIIPFTLIINVCILEQKKKCFSSRVLSRGQVLASGKTQAVSKRPTIHGTEQISSSREEWKEEDVYNGGKAASEAELGATRNRFHCFILVLFHFIF